MASDPRPDDEQPGEPYSLAPPEQVPPPAPPPGSDCAPQDAPTDADDRQFSLTGLLVVIGLAGLVLLPARLLPPSIYAGFLGIMAAVLLPVVTLLRSRPLAHLAWWCLLGLYVLAMGYVLLSGRG